jgi:hypothetical protein
MALVRKTGANEREYRRKYVKVRYKQRITKKTGENPFKAS